MVRSKVQNLHSKTKKYYIAKELDDFNATVISKLKLMCEQQNPKEIAAKLGLSAHSINKYRAILMEKTNSSNMAGMVIFAIKVRIILTSS